LPFPSRSGPIFPFFSFSFLAQSTPSPTLLAAAKPYLSPINPIESTVTLFSWLHRFQFFGFSISFLFSAPKPLTAEPNKTPSPGHFHNPLIFSLPLSAAGRPQVATWVLGGFQQA
jgi:hypothetical protein